MYKHLLVAVDNSSYADQAGAVAVELARKLGAQLTGVHVTNAGLHTHAFRLLEGSLPEHFQREEILHQQREIHEDLIRKGLTLISDSYLAQLRACAAASPVSCETKVLEGRHYEILSKEINTNPYDLSVFGHLGLGECARSVLGGVVERVARRIRKDLLVVKSPIDSQARLLEDGKILVGVDGSENSFWALQKAITLAKRFQAQLHVMHIFDPDFHRVIFEELVGVLTREAAQVFDFESQQALHDQVIDRGLEQVGRSYLRRCEIAAEQVNIPIQAQLLKGKFFEKIIEAAGALGASLVVLGRWGRHRIEISDLGSTAENVLRLAPCSVLIISTDIPESMKHLKTANLETTRTSIRWSDEAEALIRRAPDFVQQMARALIEDWAGSQGLREIQSSHVVQAMKDSLPEKMWRKMLKEEP
jgi:nucleotide-binding universal stress UspA family protein